MVHHHQFSLLFGLHPGVRWCSLLYQGTPLPSPALSQAANIEHQVGSGETFGNNAIVEEEEEEEGEEFIDDLDVEQDWEDLEDWNPSELPVSIINQWPGVPRVAPPPPNDINLALPSRTSYLSARSLYGMNGSLTDSSESLPVQAKLNSSKKGF